MKKNIPIFSLLFLHCLTTSLQCNNCTTKPLLLGKEKSWLPSSSKTELTFVDLANNSHVFSLNAIDKTELVANNCNEFYQVQYINTTLYLNNSRTDSIFFSLRASDWLCLNAYSKGEPSMMMCNVFGRAREGRISKYLANFTIGNHQYKDVILTVHAEGFSDNIDSLFIADHAGIVGFKYNGVSYALE